MSPTVQLIMCLSVFINEMKYYILKILSQKYKIIL